MSKIDEQIEAMAEKMEKSTTSPEEGLFAVIKSLGKDGLKAKLPTLSEEEKGLLKSALESMNLKKAVSFDDAYAAKMIQGKVTDTIIQEEIASDDADEKLVKPAANKQSHQGTATEGWEGQVIKSLEENLDQVIEKAMEKCKDDKMVMKKLKEKGMDESKVQGALDKYKAKQEVKKSDSTYVREVVDGKEVNTEIEKAGDREVAKEKIMSMEEKEHGTKDPKKLVAAEKKEHMKKSAVWEDETRLLKANTLGRNFTFNVEQFVNDTIANAPEEPVQKSGGPGDINEIIAKGEDRTWEQVMGEVRKTVAVAKQDGQLVKSFDELTDLAESMGISIEEARKILGE